MNDRIMDALQSQLSEEFGVGVIVTKYVVVSEVMDEQGRRILSRIPSDNSTLWDSYGMLKLVAADMEADFAVATEMWDGD